MNSDDIKKKEKEKAPGFANAVKSSCELYSSQQVLSALRLGTTPSNLSNLQITITRQISLPDRDDICS